VSAPKPPSKLGNGTETAWADGIFPGQRSPERPASHSRPMVGDDRISGLYDLSQPGQYKIQVSRAISDNPKAGVVKSNTITVTVTE
jgi:hypothetical protein